MTGLHLRIILNADFIGFGFLDNLACHKSCHLLKANDL